jgi:hypothetical protein
MRARALFDAQFSREIAVQAYLKTFAKCLNIDLPANAKVDVAQVEAFRTER